MYFGPSPRSSRAPKPTVRPLRSFTGKTIRARNRSRTWPSASFRASPAFTRISGENSRDIRRSRKSGYAGAYPIPNRSTASREMPRDWR